MTARPSLSFITSDTDEASEAARHLRARYGEVAPDHADIIIDGGGAMFIDHDILELIEDFRRSARDRHIRLVLRNFPSSKFDLFTALSNKVYHG